MSYESFYQNRANKKRLKELEEENAELKERIVELEARISELKDEPRWHDVVLEATERDLYDEMQGK